MEAGETLYSVDFKQVNRDLDGVTSYFALMEYGHCGHLATCYVNNLKPFCDQWEVFDLRNPDGRVHSVVEVTHQKQNFTIDPMLRMIYPSSHSSLISGEALFHQNAHYQEVEPEHRHYYGSQFLLRCEILRSYKSETQLVAHF